MTPDDLAHVIQLILTPVVMITACALTLNGIMGHYQAVSGRLRALARERIDLIRGKERDEHVTQERLVEIDHEAPALLRRHELIHLSLVVIEISMTILVCCMLVIGVASVSGSQVLASGVLVLFLLGTLLLLAGLVLSAIEIAMSRRELAYEVRRVLRLEREA